MLRPVYILLWVICFKLTGLQPVCAQGHLPDVDYQQCSAIREIIFAAHSSQFEQLILYELKGSHGYQVNGSWRFETVQYASLLNWQGASKTYIDHSEERTDTSHIIIRQYVAEYSNLPNADAARFYFEQLNMQMHACRLPLNDSSITVLKPLPLEKIQDALPVAALDARLYPVSVRSGNAASSNQEVVIMTAWERTGNRYNVYMIVEYRTGEN